MKHEWRKHEKEYYLPKTKPELIKIPEFKFFSIKGIGNPNSKLFSEAITCLYSLSYAVRMSYKWDTPPSDYYEYTVYPLEGIWDIADLKLYEKEGFNKDNLAYEIMIRQPDFVTDKFAKEIIEFTQDKKPQQLLDQVQFKTIEDGNVVQTLHLGSYDDEPQTFEKMKEFIQENGLEQRTKVHREIYLTDARKTAPEKQKTILRYFLS
jgi:hypothetical protein